MQRAVSRQSVRQGLSKMTVCSNKCKRGGVNDGETQTDRERENNWTVDYWLMAPKAPTLIWKHLLSLCCNIILVDKSLPTCCRVTCTGNYHRPKTYCSLHLCIHFTLLSVIQFLYLLHIHIWCYYTASYFKNRLNKPFKWPPPPQTPPWREIPEASSTTDHFINTQSQIRNVDTAYNKNTVNCHVTHKRPTVEFLM